MSGNPSVVFEKEKENNACEKVVGLTNFFFIAFLWMSGNPSVVFEKDKENNACERVVIWRIRYLKKISQ